MKSNEIILEDNEDSCVPDVIVVEPVKLMVGDIAFPATPDCEPEDRLTDKSPIYDLGDLAPFAMRIYKMKMRAGQTVAI